MGTHPIFESDFDCLTDMSNEIVQPYMAVYAFDSLVNRLNNQNRPPVPQQMPQQPFPLFVTWKITSNGHLRGCIGCFDALYLPEGIHDYSLTAALNDSRFDPVRMTEVSGLSCTVSLLTNFEPAQDCYDWSLEKHGIRIKFYVNGRRFSATYLPHVATEQGWNQDQALDSLISKAGFKDRKSYKDVKKSLELERYQSQTVTLSYEQYLEFKQ